MGKVDVNGTYGTRILNGNVRYDWDEDTMKSKLQHDLRGDKITRLEFSNIDGCSNALNELMNLLQEHIAPTGLVELRLHDFNA